MPFIIDGHNLIGQLPDIQLDDPDDEAKLIARLQSFSARMGKRITVFFDRGTISMEDPPPTARGLEVVFVRPPRTADHAIRSTLKRLGGAAQNWTVVSSDRAVQGAARRAGARLMSSLQFARLLEAPGKPTAQPEKPDGIESEEEIAFWERLFRDRK